MELDALAADVAVLRLRLARLAGGINDRPEA